MIKYKVISIDTNRANVTLQDELNELATQGWELIQIIDNKAFLRYNPTTHHSL